MSLKHENALNDAISNFYTTTNRTEINTHLSMMLEVYVQHAQIDREDLANAVSLTIYLKDYLNQLEDICKNNAVAALPDDDTHVTDIE